MQKRPESCRENSWGRVTLHPCCGMWPSWPAGQVDGSPVPHLLCCLLSNQGHSDRLSSCPPVATCTTVQFELILAFLVVYSGKRGPQLVDDCSDVSPRTVLLLLPVVELTAVNFDFVILILQFFSNLLYFIFVLK